MLEDLSVMYPYAAPPYCGATTRSASGRACARPPNYWVNAMDDQPYLAVNRGVDPGLIQVIEHVVVPRLRVDQAQQILVTPGRRQAGHTGRSAAEIVPMRLAPVCAAPARAVDGTPGMRAPPSHGVRPSVR